MFNRESLIALQSICIKEITRYFRIWVQTLLPPAITMTLYFVIFGQLIGQRVGQMGGVSYMEYIAPGIIMMSVITNSYSNVVSSFFSAKFQRSIEEMLVSPVPTVYILLGYIFGGVSRGLLTGVIVTIVASQFVSFQVNSWPVVIFVVTLTSMLFATGGLVNAIFAKKFDDISIVPTFILTPLTYLGGVFYSIKLLPEFWQTVSLANPILYMVNAFRYGFLGFSDINITNALILISLFIVGLLSLAYYLLSKGIGIRT
ncbi:ABC transporter permease [Aliikangiella coralliicola]|uniref:Transport permease protein n=1 Tax=Aliikangiella coralliicola TaxID=2592383 RepID=A0A545TW92_9GAMM|nr:ABC transporter permease [Aliikangiella coralliicola]TQV81474.1 ABC transporter permease [Aliikangiella coralliicola]